MKNLNAIILAAGRGKRMKSDLPKVLHCVGGRPLFAFSLLSAFRAGATRAVLVVPENHEAIRGAAECYVSQGRKIDFAVQNPPRGTGDAVRCAIKSSRLSQNGSVLVLNGDMPLIRPETLKALCREHSRQKAAVTLLTACKKDPQGFGRILRDVSGKILGSVEEKDATPLQKKITEMNVGVYIFDAKFLTSAVDQLRADNAQNEYYLPDLVAMAIQNKLHVASVLLDDEDESLGANSQAELAMVNEVFYRKRRDELRGKGVKIIGSEIFVDADAMVAEGAMLESPCHIKFATKIESGVVIETGNVIKSSRLKKDAYIKAHCYLEDAEIGIKAQVGPFAHLRPGTVLKENVKVGNFVETKKSILGKGSKANHLSYVGDATVGKNVNIGAGTITCNYDGFNKFKTVIEDDVMIGSDTQLVAPVKVGKGAYVGAGTTVTKNVARDALVISRTPQREISGWAIRKRKNAKH